MWSMTALGGSGVDKGMKVLSLRAANAAQTPAVQPAGKDAQMTFGVATRAWDTEAFVVSAYGDVDCVTAPELERELLGAVQLGADRVLVDLTETTFVDSSAIHTLIRSGERLHASGLQLEVVCGNPNVTKVLEITGVDQALPIYATIEQATSTMAPGEELAASVEPAAKAGAFASLAQHVRQTALRMGASPRFDAHDIVSADHEGGSPA